MPAVCKKYKKAAYESIDKIAKFAKAQGKEDYDVAGAKKDFDKDYAELKELSKQEQEAACKGLDRGQRGQSRTANAKNGAVNFSRSD